MLLYDNATVLCDGILANPHPATIATLASSFDGGAIGGNDMQ